VHVCFLCNEYPPGQHGGVGSVTQTIARALAARGHRATVVGWYGSHEAGVEVDRGVRVVRLAHTHIRGAGFLLNGSCLRRAILNIHDEAPIDILEGPENAFATLPRHLPGETVIRMHGGHHFFSVTLGRKPRLKRSWFEHRSFARAHHLCAVSDFVARTTLDLLHLDGRAVEILPNPVDVTEFRPRPEVAVEDGLIVFTGTIIEKK
jgi:glycosyltransferase involved in cell wall biosynthesis